MDTMGEKAKEFWDMHEEKEEAIAEDRDMKRKAPNCCTTCPAYSVCMEEPGSPNCNEALVQFNGAIVKAIQDIVGKPRRNLMKKKKSSSLKIVEGIVGVWHYHLSETGENCKPTLCGNTRVMQTALPLDSWGVKGGNVPSSYCEKCDKLYKGLK
jgi:hypothetical protein